MRRALAAAAAGLLLVAGSATAAENPVLDPEDDVDIADALAEATAVQDVCYGYVLTVYDADTGVYGGTYASSSAGPGVVASAAPECRDGVVELEAVLDYTSSFSEAEDRAGWRLTSSLPALTIDDVEDLGLSAGDLLDDGTSYTTLSNAVLALPRLAAEQAGLPPVVLEPNTSALPPDARPTGTPGSDWLRENGALLALCVLLVLAGVLVLATSGRSRSRRAAPARPPRSRSSAPPDWSPR